jgi:curved DNA-binding protein CbpA
MAKQTLYEILGVSPDASTAALQSAYRERVGALEAARAGVNPQEYKDQAQLLRLALSTLTDPVTRIGYDAKLSAASGTTAAATVAPGLPALPALPALRMNGATANPATNADARADALSLRADALALRADAMLVRAGVEPPDRQGGMAGPLASGAITWLRRLASALGLLVMVFIGAFVFTRCTAGDPSARRATQESKAAEKAALQDYYQTHGVRPANMAELELLETERRRRSNQDKQQDLGRDKQERQEREFEQDARRRAEEVSRQLRYDEDRARSEAQREADRERHEKLMKEEREQQRVERQEERWRQELRR